MSPIKQRILYFIESQNIRKSLFYKESGITRGVLDKPSGISEDNILKFITWRPDVRLEWLICGAGNMIKDSNIQDKKNQNINNVTLEELLKILYLRDKEFSKNPLLWGYLKMKFLDQRISTVEKEIALLLQNAKQTAKKKG